MSFKTPFALLITVLLLGFASDAAANRCTQIFASTSSSLALANLHLGELPGPHLRALQEAGDYGGLLRELRRHEAQVAADRLEGALVKELEQGPLRGYPVYLHKGSTEVYLVELQSGLKAIFKPDPVHWVIDSKRENWLYSNSNGEVATYVLSRLLQLDLIPPTVIRHLEGKRGSLQLFVQGEVVGDNPSILTQSPYLAQSQKLHVLDYLVRNADRNRFNMMIAEGVLWGIDHGSTFHPLNVRARSPRLTEFSRERIDPELFARLIELTPELLEAHFKKWLEPELIRDLLHRREDMIEFLSE